MPLGQLQHSLIRVFSSFLISLPCPNEPGSGGEAGITSANIPTASITFPMVLLWALGLATGRALFTFQNLQSLTLSKFTIINAFQS
jgi:hypothetical protein